MDATPILALVEADATDDNDSTVLFSEVDAETLAGANGKWATPAAVTEVDVVDGPLTPAPAAADDDDDATTTGGSFAWSSSLDSSNVIMTVGFPFLRGEFRDFIHFSNSDLCFLRSTSLNSCFALWFRRRFFNASLSVRAILVLYNA